MIRALLALAAACVVLAAPQRPVEGNPTSPVRVVIYEDLQCDDCAAFRRMLDEKLLPRYARTVAFEHRDFPLAKHAWARRAAIAARFFAAQNPELGLEYRKAVFADQPRITPANFDENLGEFARRHNIDPAAAVRALSDASLAEQVQKDYDDGVARGVSHTPTVFVNGRPFVESFTFEEISKGIDQALAQTH
jgi:protein-disulfide isomerase